MTTSTVTTNKKSYNFDSMTHHFPCRVEAWAAAWSFALWHTWPAGVWWGRRQHRWPRGWLPPGTPAPPRTGSTGDLPRTSQCSALCGVTRGQSRSKVERSSQYTIVFCVRELHLYVEHYCLKIFIQHLHNASTGFCETEPFVSHHTDRYWSVRPRPEPGRWQRRSWGPACRRVWPPTHSSGWG